jgi:formate dehydrogenase iron-sulfur subunit
MSERRTAGRDPAAEAGWRHAPPRVGFFTDTSVCIGCKACEVACKEWNAVPDDGFALLGSSYDNTGALGASSWRHVMFVEQGGRDDVLGRTGESALAPAGERPDFRWLMASDVCKHCTDAGCLDVCPTGALMRTEFGTVVVQDDICNGCGYCVAACPFGVIERRPGDRGVTAGAGTAQKCTLCYDRLKEDLTPACAKACPTESIQFGELDDLRRRAERRVEQLRARGVDGARLYGEDPDDGLGGAGAFFLLLDEPEVYGLPPDPVAPTRDLPAVWRQVGLAAATMLAGAVAAFAGRRG